MNIGILTGNSLSDFMIKTLNPILVDKSVSIKVAVVDGKKQSIWQKVKKNLKRGRGGYIIVMAIRFIIKKKRKDNDTKEFCNKNGIDIIVAKEPYSSDTIDRIKKYNLDILILLGGYGIIKEPLLKITPKGVLSYHHGNMRKYRGMPPCFWELFNNEKEMGVTVQILSTGLDRGIPVVEKTIEIKKDDSLKKLQSRAYNQSIDMLHKALKQLSNKGFTPVVIEKYGNVYTLPNFRQWIILNIKLLWRKIS